VAGDLPALVSLVLSGGPANGERSRD